MQEDPKSPASHDLILARIERIVREAVGRTDVVISPSTKKRDVAGWDSLAHVSIVLGVEKEFGIRLRAADIAQLEDVQSILRLVTPPGA